MRRFLQCVVGMLLLAVWPCAGQGAALGHQIGDGARMESSGGCGESWSARTPGTSNHLYGVTWAGSQFVAVGDHGMILTSPDAVTWTARTSGTGSQIYSVVWTGSLLVAASEFGDVLTSPDGITWTSHASGLPTLGGVAWSGSRLVVVGGVGRIATSPDGETWTERTSGTYQDLYTVGWTGSVFVAAGYGGRIVTSPDGITWSLHTPGTPEYAYGVGGSESQIIVVGSEGVILTSPDGTSWTSQVSGTGAGLYAVAWTGTQFVVVGGSGTVLTSPDGSHWTGQNSGTGEYLEGLTWSGTQLVAVGPFGTVVASACGAISYSFARWIPAVIHKDVPSKNAKWRSDVAVLNRSKDTANLTITMYPAAGPVSQTTQLAGLSQLLLTDVAGWLGVTMDSGPLEVTSDQDFFLCGRTYNQVDATHTYGQDYEGQKPSELLTAGDSATSTAWLPQLTENSSYRTNIGITNTGSETANVTMTIYDASGNQVWTDSRDYAAGGFYQYQQPYLAFGGIANGYAKVTVNSGSGVVAYASVVDANTGDPTTITMKK